MVLSLAEEQAEVVEEGRWLRLGKKCHCGSFCVCVCVCGGGGGGGGGGAANSAFLQEVFGWLLCFSSSKDYSTENQGCNVSQKFCLLYFVKCH